LNRSALVILFLALAATTAPKSAQSQDFSFEEFHTWWDIATIYNFNTKLRYDGDYGTRGVLTDRNWSLVYLRPSVRYRSRPWLTLHGGAALFYNFFRDTEDLPEIRPWVGLRLTGPSPGGFVISNYFRLELRAFYLKQYSDWEAVLRGRWQVQVTSPAFGVVSADDFYALASVEVFQDLGSSVEDAFGDRFRINFGVGKAVSQALRVDLNYLFHKIRVIGEDGSDLDSDDHVIRLRFFYSIS